MLLNDFYLQNCLLDFSTLCYILSQPEIYLFVLQKTNKNVLGVGGVGVGWAGEWWLSSKNV